MQLTPGDYPEWQNYGSEIISPWDIRAGDYVDILGSRQQVVDLDVGRRVYGTRGERVSVDAVVRSMPGHSHSEGELLAEKVLWTLYLEGGQSITIYGDDHLLVYRHRLGAGATT